MRRLDLQAGGRAGLLQGDDGQPRTDPARHMRDIRRLRERQLGPQKGCQGQGRLTRGWGRCHKGMNGGPDGAEGANIVDAGVGISGFLTCTYLSLRLLASARSSRTLILHC